MFEFTLTIESLLSLFVLVIVVALPIKVGAHLVHAERRGILWCFLAAVIGVMAGDLTAILFGGLIGGTLAAAVGFVLGVRFILGTTLLGAVGVALVALGVTLLAAALLSREHAPPGIPI